MKTGRKRSVVVLASVVVMLVGAIQVAAEIKADAYSVEDDTSTAIVQSGQEGSAVTVMYEATSPSAMPDNPGATDVFVGGTSPTALFSGDLSTQSGLRFRVVGDGMQPSFIAVYFQRHLSNRVHIWRHEGVEVSQTAGEWTVIRVPLDPHQGWIPTHTVGSRYTLEETWAADIAAVDEIFVRIMRDGHPAQTYSLADFRLVGSGDGAITAPARLSLVEDYFGVASMDDIDRTVDSDYDGMSDYDELRAGLDPQDPNSVFQASMEKATAGNTVRWPAVLGGRYAIMRSNDLRAGFKAIGEKSAGFTGTEQWTDENPLENAPNFYKVVKL